MAKVEIAQLSKPIELGTISWQRFVANGKVRQTLLAKLVR
jgi:hypothetical protein